MVAQRFRPAVAYRSRGSIPQFPLAMAIPAMEPQLRTDPLDPPGEYQRRKWVPYYKTPEFSSWLSIANVSDPGSQTYQEAVTALDAIYGHTWSDQYHEERRMTTSVLNGVKLQLIGEY